MENNVSSLSIYHIARHLEQAYGFDKQQAHSEAQTIMCKLTQFTNHINIDDSQVGLTGNIHFSFQHI
ncbi:hypothetical protein [Shewanella gelidii]|uniref:Uncharacterized protein n=1 Tax=Shewanella gelidii TaxID=1642821 RepID=A0A917JJC9_9GAMM|nr:hypothetical protein [Shewanella gelidii]MCL1096372.1 hypothetical protein [Shewanella gelidii]GGI67060.1 hypothetical protein GCM10009332_00020 [Shewanella gelidii]